MLGLVMAAGGTGYSLPWDARAFFSTRVAEGLMAGLPFVGRNGETVVTRRQRHLDTHSLAVLCASRASYSWIDCSSGCLACVWIRDLAKLFGPRHAIAAGLVFLALALWCLKYPAPLGPSVAEMTAEYLPRPGSQFLWLYQSLKYIPGGLGSITGVVLPGIVLMVLIRPAVA